MKFEGIINFRDLGSIKTNSDDKIPSKHVLRSADLYKATQNDIEVLKDEYHLSLIIDLRAPHEIKGKEDPIIEGVEYLNIEVIDFERNKMPLDSKDFLRPEVKLDLKETYESISKDEWCLSQFNKCIDIIENYDYSKGSILFHCATGKDRTGILALLLLKKHGYEWRRIEKDYLESNKAFKKYAFFGSIWAYKQTKSFTKMKELKHFYKMSKKNIIFFK